jgi:hypothetical protein
VKIGRTNWIGVLCIGIALAFFGPMMFCFGDASGSLPCCDSDRSEHRHDATACEPSSQANCCPSHSGSALMSTGLAGLPLELSIVGIAFQTDDAAPDDRVRKIDHPPQSS